MAVRTNDEDEITDGEKVEGPDPEMVANLEYVQKYYEMGKDKAEKVTCEDLVQHMVTGTKDVREELHAQCGENSCDFSTLNVTHIALGQQVVTSLAALADRKECLPQVMSSVQSEVQQLLLIVPMVLRAAPTDVGRARVQEAFLQLVSFQEGALALKSELTDRWLLLDDDIAKENCPAPCGHCDHKGSSAFGFRCLLSWKYRKGVPVLPAHHGVECGDSKFRIGWRFRFSKQCRVKDWKESALQHVHVSAMLWCGSTTMLMGLNGPLPETTRREMHRICLKREQGNALTTDEHTQYEAQLSDTSDDDAVPNGLKLAVTNLLVVGMASGLAGLRDGTRGNARPALLEGGVEHTDFTSMYSEFLLREDPPLVVREADRAMYASQHLIRRDETLHKLEQCEEMYELKSKYTFLEGATPLSVMTSMIRKQEGDIAGAARFQQGSSDVLEEKQTWGQWIFGTVQGAASMFLLGLVSFFTYFVVSFQGMAPPPLFGNFGLMGLMIMTGFFLVLGTAHVINFLWSLIFGKGLISNALMSIKMSEQMDKCMAEAQYEGGGGDLTVGEAPMED